MKHGVLIVDDEPANLQKLKRTFLGEYEVHEALGGKEALEILEHNRVSVIITDQRMPGMNGVELLRRSLDLSPESVRIILTGYTEVEDLMDAINRGHVHRYITKPWEPLALREMVHRELESWELERENVRLSEELRKANEKLSRENFKLRQEVEVLREGGRELIYESQAMEDLIKLLERVVSTSSTVLIQGETGTGKELLARYIHEKSPRSQRAFVPVNCGAIPAELVESAFFGHKKGAFTGATENKKGYFELADGGTLFLDEISEAPLELQVKLLRVLQEREIYPVGAERPKDVDVRIVASTNRNLGQEVEKGTFRQDLFFRLNVFAVQVPPLRARVDDVETLAEFFRSEAAKRLNRGVDGFEEKVLELMRRYSWPGNVRELQNEVERLVILCEQEGRIGVDLLSERIRFQKQGDVGQGLKEQVAALERDLILRALKSCDNNKTRAASLLGITRQTIINKMKGYRASVK